MCINQSKFIDFPKLNFKQKGDITFYLVIKQFDL
jgi:hypothetical protein